ncbi:FG-GAP repeat domain-containing protein [Nannocystis pusilla]|uniref:FG-GAP repeat domain-containing protein n=1 Tax=Nannocystis pusilla TaxID=889268 RepID=UPI003B776817
MTEVDPGRFGPEPQALPRTLAALDLDGDGAREVLSWRSGPTAQLLRADVALTPLRTIEVGDARRVEAADGESLLFASYPTSDPARFEVRMLDVAGESPRVVDVWPDSVQMHATALDFDGDGRREVYLGTEAYERRFWRIERDEAGVWTRRSAHGPTEAAGSDLSAVLSADLEGDGRPEIVVAAGPWKAYDLRIFKPTPAGELDLVVRRAFGSYQAEGVRTMRAPAATCWCSRRSTGRSRRAGSRPTSRSASRRGSTWSACARGRSRSSATCPRGPRTASSNGSPACTPATSTATARTRR